MGGGRTRPYIQLIKDHADGIEGFPNVIAKRCTRADFAYTPVNMSTLVSSLPASHFQVPWTVTTSKLPPPTPSSDAGAARVMKSDSGEITPDAIQSKE